MFGTVIIRKCITKRKKSGFIHKDINNKPGSVFPVDQLQSAHPVLVPQFSCKLTSTRIWDAQVRVDHFSDLTYVHHMIITRQEETLIGKAFFEIWAATFGIKTHRYHAENGIFGEKNQTRN